MKTKKPYDLEPHRWKRPDSYAGSSWPAYYIAAGRSRDSDALEESNFRVILKHLGGEGASVETFPTAEDGAFVVLVREHHWAVGWVEWIGVHENNAAGLAELREIWAARESYPVLDEEDFCAEEEERAMLGLTNCYDLSEEDAARVADWCGENGWALEGEDYASAGVEEAKAALGIA